MAMVKNKFDIKNEFKFSIDYFEAFIDIDIEIAIEIGFFFKLGDNPLSSVRLLF